MQVLAVVTITAPEVGTSCGKVFCDQTFREGDEAVLLLDGRRGLTVHCTRHNELPQEDPR